MIGISGFSALSIFRENWRWQGIECSNFRITLTIIRNVVSPWNLWITVGRLFQVHLNVQGSPAIYHASPGKAEQTQLQEGVAMLLEWTQSRACVSLIQHPYWLETAQILPNQRTVYDCMDHHGGFADNSRGSPSPRARADA